VRWSILFSLAILAVCNVSYADSDDYMENLRLDALSECPSTDNVECLLNIGRGLSALEDSTPIEQSMLIYFCAGNSSASSLTLLRCVFEQKQLSRANPYPEFSLMRLMTDKMRPYWVSLCKTNDGKDVSDCVESKYVDFTQVWQLYLELPGKSASEVELFKNCAPASLSVDWSVSKRCIIR
jgi:hypothetical protein